MGEVPCSWGTIGRSRRRPITCHWCGEKRTDGYLTLHLGHIGAFITHDGARYDFDFCDWSCMDEWRAHEQMSKRVLDGFAEQFVDFTDDDLASSNLVGASGELIRRQRAAAATQHRAANHST